MELLRYDTRSALQIADNPHQHSHKYKRVLCVCSAGVLRSATAAVVLSQDPYNFNTRSAGCHSYALVPINAALEKWADEIVCMTQDHKSIVSTITKKPVICLNIPDNFAYRDPQLIDLIKTRYDAATRYPQG